MPYGSAGVIILDVTDMSRLKEIGQLSFSPPFHSQFGVHSVLPLTEKGLAYVNSEDTSYGEEPLHHASIVDISDPSNPMLLSIFPEPTRRYGPMPEGKLALQTEDVLVDRRGFIYITHKNQGLWILKYRK